MFIVYCYNEDINDISVTLSVQSQVFFVVVLFCPFVGSIGALCLMRCCAGACDSGIVPAVQWFCGGFGLASLP